MTATRPRSRVLAGGAAPVTERSEGNPEGVDGRWTAGDLAVERAGSGTPPTSALGVGSSNTRPGDRSVATWPGWDVATDLRFVKPGYVINRWTGEVLSSVLADVREQRER